MTVDVTKPLEPVEPVINEPTKTPTMAEILAENESLKAQNFKVLGEKKKFKSDFEELNDQNETKRQEELKQKEDYKTMLEESNKKIDELNGKLTKREENSLSKSIAFNVQRLAGDAKDVTDIIDKIDISEENIDNENETLTDLAEQIDKIRKTKPYLFEDKKPGMTTKLPNMSGISNSGSKKPLKTRIAEQLMKK